MIAVVTALWKRHALERLTLRRLNRAFPTAHKIAAVSEPGAVEVAREAGWHPVEVENRPLGRKFNAAVAAAQGANGVVIAGSDNWFADGAGAFYTSLECDYFGLLDVFIVANEAQGRHFQYRSRRQGEPIGAGRFIHGRTLEQLDWTPWDPKADRSLDYSMTRRLSAISAEQQTATCAASGLHLIGIKTKVNITPWHRMRRSKDARVVARDEILAPFPADEVAELKCLLDGAER